MTRCVGLFHSGDFTYESSASVDVSDGNTSRIICQKRMNLSCLTMVEKWSPLTATNPTTTTTTSAVISTPPRPIPGSNRFEDNDDDNNNSFLQIRRTLPGACILACPTQEERCRFLRQDTSTRIRTRPHHHHHLRLPGPRVEG